MNFVDALRQVNALKSEQPVRTASPAPAVQSAPIISSAAMDSAAVQDLNHDEVALKVVDGGDGTSIVKIELKLTPEQTHSLLKSALTTNHRYLTLREAAHYLRTSMTTLESLVNDGTIPAYEIDGAHRFDRFALDQWAKTAAAPAASDEEDFGA